MEWDLVTVVLLYACDSDNECVNQHQVLCFYFGPDNRLVLLYGYDSDNECAKQHQDTRLVLLLNGNNILMLSLTKFTCRPSQSFCDREGKIVPVTLRTPTDTQRNRSYDRLIVCE